MSASQINPNSVSASEVTLADSCGYSIQGDRVLINIAEIANHREPGDISGTLSVELWALKEPYAGGNFDGVALAGTRIGEISGQHFLTDCRYDLLFQEPPAGSWYLTLMLREWTEVGYVTRSHANFTLPYTVASQPEVVPNESDKVINAAVSSKEKTPAKPAAKPAAKRVEPRKAEAPKATATKTPKPPQAKPAAVAPAKAAKAPVTEEVAKRGAAVKETEKKVEPPKPAQEKPAAPTVKAATLSLNEADYKEIAAMKGVSKKLAKHIVAARPFQNFEALLKVKGMGPKLLQKIQKHFHL